MTGKNESYSDEARAFLHEEITRLVRSGVPHDEAFAAAVAEARKRGYRIPDALK